MPQQTNEFNGSNFIESESGNVFSSGVGSNIVSSEVDSMDLGGVDSASSNVMDNIGSNVMDNIGSNVMDNISSNVMDNIASNETINVKFSDTSSTDNELPIKLSIVPLLSSSISESTLSSSKVVSLKIELLSTSTTNTPNTSLTIDKNNEVKNNEVKNNTNNTSDKKGKHKEGDDTKEPLLVKSNKRFVIPPKTIEPIWKMAKQQQASMWTAEEIDLAADLRDWQALSLNAKNFIKMILCFFSGADGIVTENLAQRFLPEVQIPEVRYFYSFQLAVEQIHSETYTKLIDTYITDPKEKNECFNAMDTVPTISRKAEWANRWISSPDASFAERLIAFAVVEGVFFSGAFCAIYWIKKMRIMPGLTFSNELISRDEGLHCDFAILLYTTMIECKLSQERMEEIFREAVDIEKEFIIDAIPVSMIGMNCKLMSQYIEFVADRLLVSLGYRKIYDAKNPFDWMEMISLSGKTNFFEKRVGEYRMAHVCVDKEDENDVDDEFTTEADF